MRRDRVQVIGDMLRRLQQGPATPYALRRVAGDNGRTFRASVSTLVRRGIAQETPDGAFVGTERAGELLRAIEQVDALLGRDGHA